MQNLCPGILFFYFNAVFTDYETNPIIKLTLTARDHGTPPLSDSSELIIKVSDVNDNDPIFEQEVGILHYLYLHNNRIDTMLCGASSKCVFAVIWRLNRF